MPQSLGLSRRGPPNGPLHPAPGTWRCSPHVIFLLTQLTSVLTLVASWIQSISAASSWHLRCWKQQLGVGEGQEGVRGQGQEGGRQPAITPCLPMVPAGSVSDTRVLTHTHTHNTGSMLPVQQVLLSSGAFTFVRTETWAL